MSGSRTAFSGSACSLFLVRADGAQRRRAARVVKAQEL